MSDSIKIIDLFAGPGGLGEGFSAYKNNNKERFKIALSIEKEKSAHRTLLLRSFFRQYSHKEVPEEYYAFLRGELDKNPEDKLYRIPELQDAIEKASIEAQQLTLGKDHPKIIYRHIRNAVGKEDFILIGGPPCQAYSVIGRSRNFGAKDKKYSSKKDTRNFLYKEYLKIIAKFQPTIFVMENVKGILSAKVNGELIFDSILKDLRDPYKSTKVNPEPGRKKHCYKIFSFVPETGKIDLTNSNEDFIDPHDFIIRTENHGIPQARHRVILLGVREDLLFNLNNVEGLELSDTTPTVQQTISDLPKLRSKLSKGIDSEENWRNAIYNISQSTLNKLSSDINVPSDVSNDLIEKLNNIYNSPSAVGADKNIIKPTPDLNKDLSEELRTWYKDERLGSYVVNHESRGHIVGDLHRYLYYSTYAKAIGVSPSSKNLPEVLWPAHKNFNTGKFADRFRVQRSNAPGTTVTSHISKDGHYYIHYDPNQCRSLTVREAARIQTFPDNYYFAGTRTQQYVQVGNAVPPFLALQIADIIYTLLNT